MDASASRMVREATSAGGFDTLFELFEGAMQASAVTDLKQAVFLAQLVNQVEGKGDVVHIQRKVRIGSPAADIEEGIRQNVRIRNEDDVQLIGPVAVDNGTADGSGDHLGFSIASIKGAVGVESSRGSEHASGPEIVQTGGARKITAPGFEKGFEGEGGLGVFVKRARAGEEAILELRGDGSLKEGIRPSHVDEFVGEVFRTGNFGEGIVGIAKNALSGSGQSGLHRRDQFLFGVVSDGVVVIETAERIPEGIELQAVPVGARHGAIGVDSGFEFGCLVDQVIELCEKGPDFGKSSPCLTKGRGRLGA